MSSVKTNYFWNVSFQLVRLVIPLVLTPYLTRTLGSEELGIYSYTSSIATYFEIFAYLGLNQYGTREIARCGSNRQELSKTFCSIFAMQFAWGLICTATYFIYCIACSGAYFACSLAWGIWVLGEALDVTWLFFGLEEFKLTTIRNLVVRIISVVCVFILVKSPADTWLYCLIMALYFMFASLSLWPFVLRRVKLIKPKLHEVLVHVRPNIMLFAPVIAISLYTQLDRILLGVFCDMNQVGFYDQSDKVCQMPLSFITALGTVMLPHMSRLMQSDEQEAAFGLVRNSMLVSNVMAFAFCFGIAGIAPVFVPVFFGDGFQPCVEIMSLLAFEVPIIAWSNVLGIQCLIPQGMDKQYLTSVGVAAIANIVLTFVFIPPFQAFGSVVATILTELVVVLVQAFFLRAQLPVRTFARDAWPFVFIGLLMMIAVRELGFVLGSTVWGLVLQIAVGAAVYLIMCLVYATLSKGSMINALMKGLKVRL